MAAIGIAWWTDAMLPAYPPQMQVMYFAKPPVAPDIDFYKEVFTILVKHNDRSVDREPCSFTCTCI